jgi:hypothetical protein
MPSQIPSLALNRLPVIGHLMMLLDQVSIDAGEFDGGAL